MIHKRKPAQVRYDRKKPTISFRVDAALKKKLDEYCKSAGNISYADFVKQSLGAQDMRLKAVRDLVIDDGVRWTLAVLATETWTFQCDGCGADIEWRLDKAECPECLREYYPE